jgi:hypothetical protein
MTCRHHARLSEGGNALSDFIEVELKGKVNWSLQEKVR